MFALERQKKILGILQQEGVVSVANLATIFDVTEETIRRDLEKLEKQEALTRTHGGAVQTEDSTRELSLENRKRTNIESKEKLARIAVNYIAPGDTVFLDASTTTFCLAREIKKLSNVTVISNSIRVINELAGTENIKVISVGGLVSDNQSFVGNVAENTIKNCYYATKMFFSSKGVSQQVGILESNEFECAIKQKMLENSKEKFFLFDKSKIDKVGFIKLTSFDKIDHIITDADFDKDFVNMTEELGIEIIKGI